jgi:hypothetical protein
LSTAIALIGNPPIIFLVCWLYRLFFRFLNVCNSKCELLQQDLKQALVSAVILQFKFFT